MHNAIAKSDIDTDIAQSDDMVSGKSEGIQPISTLQRDNSQIGMPSAVEERVVVPVAADVSRRKYSPRARWRRLTSAATGMDL